MNDAQYRKGRAEYARMDRQHKLWLSEALWGESFVVTDGFPRPPHPDFLRGFKRACDDDETV